MKSILTWLFRWLFDLKVYHQDRLKFSGPSVIMPNHVSFLDAILMYLILPSSVWFVVNSEIAANPLVAFALRFRRHVKIDNRNPYSLRTIIGVVRAGNPVVLFPEGRISTTGGLMKMYTGAAMVARKTDAQIFPIILRGPEYSKLSYVTDKLKSQWFPAILVYVGEPKMLTPDENLSFKAQKESLNNHLLDIMQQTMFAARRQEYGAMDFFRRLQLADRQNGSSTVIVRDVTRSVTYRTLFVGIFVLAKKLRAILPASESSAGVLLPNAVAHVSVLFALFYLGKTPVIFNFSTGSRNVADSAVNAEVKTVLTSRAFIEKADLDEMVSQLALSSRIIYLEDVAATVTLLDKLQGLCTHWRGSSGKSTIESRLVLFTSGTEGRPKGVALSHQAILANIDQASSIIDYTPADRMLNALPMFHSFGLMAGTMLPILGGIELYLYPSPLHYRVVPELAYDFNATLMLGTPTFLVGYGKMAHPYDFYRMRYVLAGGEKLRPAVRELWQNKFGIRLLEGYGVTETGPVLCLNTPLATRPGTVGRFLPGIDWRLEPVEGIDNGGNLLVRGPNLMDGYHLYEKGFLPVTEWYATGDVVSVDADGFVTILARLKRFAKIAGEMINLQQVEEAALACFGSGVQVAVAAVDSRKGEKIVLFTTNHQAQRSQLRDYLLQEGHSGLLVPAEIIQLEKMPLLGSGKPDYLGLQQQAERAIASVKP